MHSFLYWVHTHQVLSAILLLAVVIAAGGWSSHHKVLVKHLQVFAKTLGTSPWDNEYNVATVEAGKHYPIMVAREETSFFVKTVNEYFAVFEVLISLPADSYNKQGRDVHGWVFKIDRTSIQPPELHASALAAGYAMERRFSVGDRKRAHA